MSDKQLSADVNQKLQIPDFLRRPTPTNEEAMTHQHHYDPAKRDHEFAEVDEPAAEPTAAELADSNQSAPEMTLDDMLARLKEMAAQRGELDKAIKAFKKSIQKRISEM